MCQPGRPGTDRRLPEGFVILAAFPQHEVARIGLVVLVDIDAGAGSIPSKSRCDSFP